MNEVPDCKLLPPEDAEYQFTVPALAVAPSVTVPVPQREAGVFPVIVGDELIVKFDDEVVVPALLVTVIDPVLAPEGTTAVIEVELTTVNEAASIPLNFTAEVPVKLVPVIVTVVPALAHSLVGVNEEIVGGFIS